MIPKLLKITAISVTAALVIAFTYAYLRPDPGPYLVALRSDTPEQVEKALKAIVSADTMIYYDGRMYAPLNTDQLMVLSQRYFLKASGLVNEPLIGDSEAWVRMANRAMLKAQAELPSRKK